MGAFIQADGLCAVYAPARSSHVNLADIGNGSVWTLESAQDHGSAAFVLSVEGRGKVRVDAHVGGDDVFKPPARVFARRKWYPFPSPSTGEGLRPVLNTGSE